MFKDPAATDWFVRQGAASILSTDMVVRYDLSKNYDINLAKTTVDAQTCTVVSVSQIR